MNDTTEPQQKSLLSNITTPPTRSASPAAQKQPAEDPTWWRYGAVPFIVLLMAAACADTGLYIKGESLGLGAGVACLLLTSAILLLRKDLSGGERCFLAGLAAVNCAAMVISGTPINLMLNFAIPFLIQIIPSVHAEKDQTKRFRTWWGYWLAHRSKEKTKAGSELAGRLRAIIPLLFCVMVGAILFTVFLTIFAQGNPVVCAVRESIVDAWNELVAFLHIGWDFVIHVFFWGLGAILFGIFTFRRPFLITGIPVAKEDGPAGMTILPQLPICSLIGVNLAFLIATTTDISYLWFRNVPQGFSQTAYLHDGAASITWAAALAASMMVYFFRRKGSARHSIPCKIAGYLLLLQTFLLAVSVYMRLYYQIGDYGFTVRRIQAAEAMLLGLAGLVILVFYVVGSGAFRKYAKICLGVMVLMLVSFNISRPARMAGDLNLRYHATHPQWEFSHADFGIGRFIIRENLEFAYYVYKQYPTPEMGEEITNYAYGLLRNQSAYEANWKGRHWAKDRDLATAQRILQEMPVCSDANP